MMYVHASNPFFDGGVCVVFYVANCIYGVHATLRDDVCKRISGVWNRRVSKCSIAEIEAS